MFWIHPAAQARLGALQLRKESDDVIYARQTSFKLPLIPLCFDGSYKEFSIELLVLSIESLDMLNPLLLLGAAHPVIA